MIYLNEYSLQYAISLCALKEGYKVFIVTATKQSVKTWFSKINSLQDYDKYITNRVISDVGSSLINFINDSSITILYSKEPTIQRCHLLIVDECIKKDIIEKVFMPCETLDYYNHTLLIRRVHNFINSFNRLKQDFPDFKITINTKKELATCEIGKTDLFTYLNSFEATLYEKDS